MDAQMELGRIERVAPDRLPLHFNISEVLLDSHIESGSGDKTAICYQDQTITYRQLSRQVNRLGNLLGGQLGVTPEARVAILLFDCPEFVASFLATIKIGAVAVPMSTMLGPQDYVYMLNDTRASVLIADQAFADVILSAGKSLEYLRHIVVLEDGGSGACAVRAGEAFDIMSYRAGVARQSDTLQTAKTNKNDAAFWGYTSGSTGQPKGTIHLQHDIYYAAYHLNQYYYDISPDDVLYSASKLFFAYGLGNSLWIPFFSGATVVLERQRSTPEVVVASLRKFRPTKVFAVPTIYKALHDYLAKPGQYAEECGSVERYYSAGEPLSKPLYDKWLALTGREILTVLGSTEALQGYVGASPGLGSPGCLGKAIRGYEIRIVDELGQVVPQREKGVLMIKGDSIASGYWNRHKETQKTFRGEWLYTGDMVYEGENGILWYVGRDDEMFKIAGLWVSPTEIEEVLNAHPWVHECAVVACEDANGLTTMVAYIVCKDTTHADSSVKTALSEFLAGQLPSHKCPRTLRLIKELPRSSTGKLQRFKLKELYLAA